jgi:hypothetical protein
MAKWLTWVSDEHLQGWACSQCEWSFPLPALLSDPEAKKAYDRLASARFQEHDCTRHPKRTGPIADDSFADRARKLVIRGFKPKDAAEITLQEILFENRNDPAMEARTRADAEDFLRRVRDGLI